MNLNPLKWFGTPTQVQPQPLNIGTVRGTARASARLKRVQHALLDDPNNTTLAAEQVALLGVLNGN